LARPELLEQRPTWAAGKPRAITTTLPALSPDDTRHMAELLLGEGAPASVVDRVCETAEGNPLYLEQLTAMLADQGLLVDGEWKGSAHTDAEVEIPGTLQALLAARLDRLDPTPRLLLERASVEGRRFRVAAMRALAPEIPPEEIEPALALAERTGFLQPEDEAGGRWRFTHALVLEAAYRGLSKGVRAELHEQLADWMVVQDADQADVDERAARHLERALHLREELGMRDERSSLLSARAGELFLAAGSRAFAALDFITSRDLLGRAAALLPDEDPRRLDMLPNLGVALTETGRSDETEALLSKAVEQSREAGSERDALRAIIQLQSNRIYRSPTAEEIDGAVTEAEGAVKVFEAMNDDVGLAEAAIALEYLEFMRGHVARSMEWTHRALRHGLRAGRFRESAQASADVVNCAVVGPAPFVAFGEVADSLLPFSEPISASAGHVLRAVRALVAGDEGEFRENERRWREVVDHHGLAWLAATQGMAIANVELWMGRPEAAESRLREARDVLDALGDIWWVGTLDSALCAAVAAQDRPQEFMRLADALEASSTVPDPQLGVRRNLARSRALLLRGSAVDAEFAARRGLELVQVTDLTLDHVDALLVLARALEARDLGDEAAKARSEAAERLRTKGISPER
jgi:tetratricopeptide (TPR) repeat protein